MAGKGPLLVPAAPDVGDTLVLIGDAAPALGGSILDVVTGCGGSAPRMADIALLPLVRDLARQGVCVTDISAGGLLAALAGYGDGCMATLEGDPWEVLFSEAPGRFLAAVADPDVLGDLPCTVIGTIGGGDMELVIGDTTLLITSDERDEALDSIRSRMMFE